MIRKISLLLVLVIVLSNCNSVEEKKNLENFSREFIKIKMKYEPLMKNIKTPGRIAEIQKDKRKELQNLLNKYDKITSSDKAELMKSKILILMDKLNEAETKINELIEDQSDVMLEAQMEKVKIFIYRQETAEALAMFRGIEGKLKRGTDLFAAYLYFTLYAEDTETVEEYGEKFLKSDIKEDSLTERNAEVYRCLAFAALKQKNTDRAKEMLAKGIAEADGTLKMILEAETAQLDFFGKPAFPIADGTWVNSSPLQIEQLKGKVVLLGFWAPWCKSCQSMIPVLVRLYDTYKDKGLMIIGSTHLYGKYSDDKEEKGPVKEDEEISLINGFIKRYKMTYPVVISPEGITAENYKVTGMPTMVFINKKGEIDFIKVGAGDEAFIEKKIKTLLEVK